MAYLPEVLLTKRGQTGPVRHLPIITRLPDIENHRDKGLEMLLQIVQNFDTDGSMNKKDNGVDVNFP